MIVCLPVAAVGSLMMRKQIFPTSLAFFILLSTANAREAIRLTDMQLDKVTAGGDVRQIPLIASFLSNGNSGISQFSPAVATLVPTITNLNICVICVTSR